MTRFAEVIKGVGGWSLRFLQSAAARIYALALAGLTIWLTWVVMSYLVRGFFVSIPSPAQVADLPHRIDAEMLQAGTAFAAFDGTDNPRMPLAHYHRFDAWYQPDRFNDCTRSGCHGPLPHQEHKESRAFLNMHATSMHCFACHTEAAGHPLDLTWYDLAEGQAAPPPPILRAYALLASPPEDLGALRDRLIELLRESASRAGGSREMLLMVEHLEVARIDDPRFPELIAAARSVVSGHMRGEYGAKLTLRNSDGTPRLGNPITVPEDAAPSSATVAAMLQQAHTGRAEHPRTCRDCHVREGGAVDFAALGYPPSRIEELLRPLVIQAISHSMEGRVFHLPGFTAGNEDAPEEDAPEEDDAQQP